MVVSSSVALYFTLFKFMSTVSESQFFNITIKKLLLADLYDKRLLAIKKVTLHKKMLVLVVELILKVFIVINN